MIDNVPLVRMVIVGYLFSEPSVRSGNHHPDISLNEQFMPRVQPSKTIIAGRYELLSLAGQGGMGAVYKARRLEIDKIVAIKVLLPEMLEDERMRKRFQQEARAAAALNHAHLTSVYDFGQTDDGAPFLVMEYIEGTTVAQLLKSKGQIEAARAASIIIQVADALAYAHKQGVIHRDIKPSNVMLLAGQRDDFATVLDFGIARIECGEDESGRLTQTGEVFGSPSYMSPEQCMGRHLDGRSDIFSLGCTFYEMLTGIVPAKGANAIQTIAKILNEPPLPLKAARPDLSFPPELERILSRCLAKDPEDRYGTATELADDLMAIYQNAGSGSSPSPRPLPSAPAKQAAPPLQPIQPPAPIQYSRPVIALALLCLAVLTCSALWLCWNSWRTAEFSGRNNTSDQRGTLPISYINQPVMNNQPAHLPRALWSLLTVELQGDPRHSQVHAFAVYSPVKEDNGEPRTVDVKINRPGNCILIFSGYQPVVWNVSTARGVHVQKVILTGYHKQSLQGLEGVPVVSSFSRVRPREFDPVWCLLLDSSNEKFRKGNEFSSICKLAENVARAPLTTFHGQYMREGFTVD